MQYHDYSDVFDDILAEYTSDYGLDKVKITNMDIMFRFTCNISLKYPKTGKEMIDKIRCRNKKS